jgi:hypothetical protein
LQIAAVLDVGLSTGRTWALSIRFNALLAALPRFREEEPETGDDYHVEGDETSMTDSEAARRAGPSVAGSGADHHSRRDAPSPLPFLAAVLVAAPFLVTVVYLCFARHGEDVILNALANTLAGLYSLLVGVPVALAIDRKKERREQEKQETKDRLAREEAALKEKLAREEAAKQARAEDERAETEKRRAVQDLRSKVRAVILNELEAHEAIIKLWRENASNPGTNLLYLTNMRWLPVGKYEVLKSCGDLGRLADVDLLAKVADYYEHTATLNRYAQSVYEARTFVGTSHLVQQGSRRTWVDEQVENIAREIRDQVIVLEKLKPDLTKALSRSPAK